MAISQEEITFIHKNKFDVPVIVTMDPNAVFKHAELFLKQNKMPLTYLKQWSSSIVEQNKIEHFPTSYFIKDGSVIKTVPGYNGPSLKKLINEYLK